ncbi:thiamin pyrophosphokinase [Phanerochaete sordida]|uniref:Thiamine pyrophosphokinase n=1 Tax=Phanerochaete sordida TaxID=48140 RepID=A0A9P3GIM3_9APHY|nr:thiamin pyrophosphokinase [Phanerochaete sordida]
MPTEWSLPFLEPPAEQNARKYALLILNQPFSLPLLQKLWSSTHWRCCADGGANRLHDVLAEPSVPKRTPEDDPRTTYLPDLIKGDLDSLRDDVREYYASQNVSVVQDHDQYSTDLMKCVFALQEKEAAEGTQYDLVILGGLSGRLDQTVHTLSYLYKLRKTRERVFCVTDDNVAWLLDAGEHVIHVNHAYMGKTCGMLPLGIDSTILTTSGLEWNLTETESHFDGMVSTSNHLVPGEPVRIKTTKPLFWTVELRVSALQ